jgi:prepilin-type N-terminal cleavage/methylation domain-containing protein
MERTKKKAAKVKMRISPIGPPKKRNRRFGFTLLELIAVMFILAMMSGLLTMRMGGGLFGGDLRLATRMIVGEVYRLRGIAAYTHRGQVLGLDVDSNRFYSLEPLADGKTLKKQALPVGVTLEDVVIFPKGKIQEGEARIRFFPNGCVDRSLIHLRNEHHEAYTLEINPVTGQITIHDTYLEQKT